jgi:hypothetical protein
MAARQLLLLLALGLLAGQPASTTARVARAGGGRAQQQLEEAIAYLHAYMPARDVDVVSDRFVNDTALLALQARGASPWAAAVPWQLFLDYVLPYASLDEPREDWRSLFWPLLRPLVAGTSTPGEAALLLNKQIWRIWGVHFKADQAPEILSPSQVIRAGYGSCSALSILWSAPAGRWACPRGSQVRAPCRSAAPRLPECLPDVPVRRRQRRAPAPTRPRLAAAQARRAGSCRPRPPPPPPPPRGSASPTTTGWRCGTAPPGASWARRSGCQRASTGRGSSRSPPSSRCRAA